MHIGTKKGNLQERMGSWKENWRYQDQNDLEFPLALPSVNRHSPAGNMQEGEWPGMQEKGYLMRQRCIPYLKLFTNLTRPPASALCSSQTLSPLVKRPLDLLTGVLVPHGSMGATWEHRDLRGFNQVYRVWPQRDSPLKVTNCWEQETLYKANT